jgi:hypothetical protein
MRINRAFLIFLFGLFFTLNLYAQTRLAMPNNQSAVAGPGQAEIIINAENSEKDILVWVNGVAVAHLAPKTREKVIVNNGNYTLEAAETTWNRNNWNMGSKKRITVDSNSNRVTVGMTMRYGGLVNLVIQSAYPITPVAPIVLASTFERAIMDALNNTVNEIIAELPGNSVLAVLSVTTSDPGFPVDFVIDELIDSLANAKKFTVVPRSELELSLIKSELNFQYSGNGDVDDNSAVGLGKYLGASTVITASISGSGALRRLRTRVLDVETAVILFTTSEAF